MKIIKKLAILILIIVKTTPQIINTYKQIYNNYINKQEEILKKTKKIIEADKVIHTTFMHEDNSDKWNNRIKKRFERQRQEIEKRIRNNERNRY